MFFIVAALAAAFWTLEDVSYEAATYWAIATMTSVGYGDVVPTDSSSRVYVCFAMFFGIAMLSTMTAFATTFLTDKDKLAEEEDSKKQMMYAMLDHYEVPWELQKEVIAAVPLMLEALNRDAFSDLTSKLPGFLEDKVTGYIRAKSAVAFPAFRGWSNVSRDTLRAFAQILREDIHPAGAIIAEEGSPATTEYFIVRGTCRVSTIVFGDPNDEDGDGDCEAELLELGDIAAGEHFGNVDLNNPDAKRSFTVMSTTVVSLLSVTLDDLSRLQAAHPEAYAQYIKRVVLQERHLQLQATFHVKATNALAMIQSGLYSQSGFNQRM
jgi:CRP-like cAMP-binding protein